MKRLLAFLISLGFLGLILWKLDLAALGQSFRATRMDWFAAALLLFIPQGAIIGYRWYRMVSNLAPITWGEAVRLVLAGNAMNLVLPSKMGDLTKAIFLKRSGRLDLARATQIVVLEKMLDVAALAFWMLLGLLWAVARAGQIQFGAALHPVALSAALLGGMAVTVVAILYFIPPGRLPCYSRWLEFLASKPRLGRVHRLFASSHEVMTLLQRAEAGRWRILGLSLLIWLLHLLQIRFFFLSLGAAVPLEAFCAFMPLAIFIGLFPLTIAGVGVRDAAIILLFSPYYPPEVLAGVGMYVTLRYLVPAAGGLPFLGRYLAMSSTEPKSTTSGVSEGKKD